MATDRKGQGGEFCCAIGCNNARLKKSCANKGFFQFPRERERCMKWVQNTRREDLLGKQPDELVKARLKVCSDHFEDAQFTVPTERRRLNWNAVPTLFAVPNRSAAVTSKRKPPKDGPSQKKSKLPVLEGLAAKPWDKNHPDWTPTLHMGHSGAKPVDVERYARAAARHARQSSQTSLSHPLLVVILHQKTRQPPDMVSQHSSSQEFTQLGNSPSSPHAECSVHTASLVTPSLVIKQEPEDEGLYQQEMSPGLDAYTASVVSDNQTDSLSIKTEHHQVTSLGFDVGTPSLLWDNHAEIKSVETQHQENTSLGVWLGTCMSDGLSDKKTDRASSKTEHHQQTCAVRAIKQEPSDEELFQNETLLGVDPQTPSVVLDNHTDMVSVKTEHQESSTLERTLPVAMHTPDDLDEDIKLDTGLFPVALYRNVHTNHTETSNNSKLLNPLKDRVSNTSDTTAGPFVCKECGAVFSKSSYLKKHMFTHTGERPYECDRCNAAFSRDDTLKQHMLTHTGERPYSCKYCDAAFSRAYTLKQHTLTHTGEKKYKCDYCEATFNQTSNLKRHMRTHTGEKPYVCDECAKRFADYSSLKRHTSLHTKDRPYVCRHQDSVESF